MTSFSLDKVARKHLINRDKQLEALEQALDWLVHHLHCFYPQHPYVRNSPLFDIKPFSELVFLCNYLLRDATWRSDARVKEMARFSQTALSADEISGLAHHDPGGIIMLAYVAQLERLTGRSTHPEADHVQGQLRRMVASGMPDLLHRARVPFRVLDLRYSLDVAGIESYLPSLSALYSQTAAAKAPNLVYLSEADMYSITHTIFYLTDMGHRSSDDVAPTSNHHLCRLVRHLLGIVVRQRNFDLAAEFLMCHHFLRMSLSTVSLAAWQILLSAQHADGAFPSPTFDPVEIGDLPPQKQEAYGFLHRYHTTLVCVGSIVAEQASKSSQT